MIPYGRQAITEADIAAVEAVLRSDFLTQGPSVLRFEQAVATAKVGAEHGVTVNFTPSALHLACRARSSSRCTSLVSSVSCPICSRFVEPSLSVT